MKNLRHSLLGLLTVASIASCSDDDDNNSVPDQELPVVGAVYAMTNGDGQVEGNIQGPNNIIAYGRRADGSLTPIGPFATGGNGGDFDGGEGLDPLISAYALTKTDDNTCLLAVNAGSNTITSFNINSDFSLSVAGTPQPTGAIGPNSIAFSERNIEGRKGLVYVTNISRPEFLAQGEPAQQGTVTGYWLLEDGTLSPIPGSTRNLPIRPSGVQFSPNGNWLVVGAINSGAAALASGSEDEITLFRVEENGMLSEQPTDVATSTLRDNAEERNLPSAIGFQIVGNNYVVVTEAREFRPNGMPPAFTALQDGSVSTWQIQPDGTLTAISQDVRSGEGNTGRTACWLDFTADGSAFFVSNAIEAGLASFSFNNGVVALIDQNAATGTGTGPTTNPAEGFANTEGWIDMWISDDGQFLYQLYGLDGTIGIFRINGTSLEPLGEESGNLPETNTQGIVAI
jgi:6-phosphogluconolactonase (cycloisomerase 2 family)